MKKTLSIIALITTITFIALAGQDFNEGYKVGWKRGYCQNEVGCYAPYAPYAPYPEYGQDNWQGGYDKGYIDGYHKRLSDGK